jgi:hypothetical protein
LAAFKKKIELNNLRMMTILEKIEEMAGTVNRVEIKEKGDPDQQLQEAGAVIETMIAELNEEGANLQKLADGLYRLGDKSVSVRLNPDAKNQI